MTIRTAGFPVAVLTLLALQFVGWTEWVLRPVVVAGPSMEPGLRPGDRVLVDLWTYRQRGPRPAEVLVIRGPGAAGPLLVKRVGRRSPIASRPRPDVPPGGNVWVEGDNSGDSLDSRQLGEMQGDRVIGRVVLRYWPPSRFGLVR